MIAALALGIQSSAIQRFGVPGLSSTYLTGTLTSLIGDAAAPHSPRSLLPSAQVLATLIFGAAVGALVVEHLEWLSPALLVLTLVSVLVPSPGMHDGTDAGEDDGSVAYGS